MNQDRSYDDDAPMNSDYLPLGWARTATARASALGAEHGARDAEACYASMIELGIYPDWQVDRRMWPEPDLSGVRLRILWSAATGRSWGDHSCTREATRRLEVAYEAAYRAAVGSTIRERAIAR